MKIIRETIVAGRTVLTKLKASANVKNENKKRKPKSNPTPEKVQKVNYKNAVWHLTSILNHNFQGGDYHITLTYKGEAPTKEEAKADRQRFLRNVKNYCDKRNIEFKYVAVTEYDQKKIHHHIVCTGIDFDVLCAKWKKGFLGIRALEDNGEYSRLAEYLVKETEKTFRRPDSVNKKRYSASRSIVIPETKKEEINSRVLHQELKAYKGYYIDQDTVSKYEHAILDVECVEYIQISLDDKPRFRKWNKGVKVNRERRYREMWPEQLEIELGF